MHLFAVALPLTVLAASVTPFVTAFPHLSFRSPSGQTAKPQGPATKRQFAQTTWSRAQLVDVTGAHAFQAPKPGQRYGTAYLARLIESDLRSVEDHVQLRTL